MKRLGVAGCGLVALGLLLASGCQGAVTAELVKAQRLQATAAVPVGPVLLVPLVQLPPSSREEDALRAVTLRQLLFRHVQRALEGAPGVLVVPAEQLAGRLPAGIAMEGAYPRVGSAREAALLGRRARVTAVVLARLAPRRPHPPQEEGLELEITFFEPRRGQPIVTARSRSRSAEGSRPPGMKASLRRLDTWVEELVRVAFEEGIGPALWS